MIQQILVLLGIFGLLTSCRGDSDDYRSLIIGDTIPVSLSKEPGNAKHGKLVFVSRERGHCILCHAISGLEVEFQGNLGPDLSNVGNRLTIGQIRLRIVDIMYWNPRATMPSYYREHDLNQVEKQFTNKTILTAQEIEDLVAFLAEQKS